MKSRTTSCRLPQEADDVLTEFQVELTAKTGIPFMKADAIRDFFLVAEVNQTLLERLIEERKNRKPRREYHLHIVRP